MVLMVWLSISNCSFYATNLDISSRFGTNSAASHLPHGSADFTDI